MMMDGGDESDLKKSIFLGKKIGAQTVTIDLTSAIIPKGIKKKNLNESLSFYLKH